MLQYETDFEASVNFKGIESYVFSEYDGNSNTKVSIAHYHPYLKWSMYTLEAKKDGSTGTYLNKLRRFSTKGGEKRVRN